MERAEAGATFDGVKHDAEEFMASDRTAIDARLAAAEQQIARLHQGRGSTPRPAQESR
jgi:hypothetical protein